MNMVWVNRFNADGSMKPISDWNLRAIDPNFEYKWYFKDVYSAHEGFHFADSIWDVKEKVGTEYNIERISNQRGDGYFDIESQRPPVGSKVIVIRNYDMADAKILEYTGIDSVLGDAFLHDSGGYWYSERSDSLIWQPILKPKI